MWDQRYSVPEYVYGTAPNDFLVAVAPRLPQGPMLCLAEGEGRNAVYLAGLGHEVDAVDASAVGLEKARRLAESRGVKLRTTVRDLGQLEIAEGYWAGIILIFCHLPAALRRPVHRACVAGLRPGGALVLEAYRPEQLALGTGGPPLRELLYTLAELREDFTGLDFVHAEELVRPLLEGSFHTGEGAVVQLLALKP
ncbi:MAG: class I SAM-dependent methyltransferase [Proteobacteria bacterium]|nr:class I SAM-dependent methyltransferase [Pseudomonadota bacterium]